MRNSQQRREAFPSDRTKHPPGHRAVNGFGHCFLQSVRRLVMRPAPTGRPSGNEPTEKARRVLNHTMQVSY